MGSDSDNETDFVCDLFGKYIDHVGEMEGVTFMESFYRNLSKDEKEYMDIICEVDRG